MRTDSENHTAGPITQARIEPTVRTPSSHDIDYQNLNKCLGAFA